MRIVHRVLVDGEKLLAVAKHYRVSQMVVSHIVTRVRKDRQHLSKDIQKQQTAQRLREQISTYVEGWNEQRKVIDSVKQVQAGIESDLGLRIKGHVIREVMLHDMGMRYRKIVKASLRLNSTRNLILRQEWAKRFIGLWDAGKTFINIDETDGLSPEKMAGLR